MSTKIYRAWRMPTKVFSDSFLPAFRKHCCDTIKKRVRRSMKNVALERIKGIWKDKGWDKKWSFPYYLKRMGSFVRLREVLKSAYQASLKQERGWGNDLDCSLNVWLHKGMAYVIPYGEPWIFDKFKFVKGMEDYCYWNNTDEPDNVTHRQWEARGKTWKEVCLNDWDAGRMVHKIISVKETTGLNEVATILKSDRRYSVIYDLE